MPLNVYKDILHNFDDMTLYYNEMADIFERL